MEKKCLKCGKLFTTKKGHSNQNYCSKSCAISSRYAEDIGLFREGIDLSAQNYIMGLIITDGCITQQGKSKIICISLNDYEMIEQIRDIVCPTRKVYRSRNNFQVKWRNSNDLIILNNNGIFERKTYSVGLNRNNPFISHVLRGVFDGDGCIYNNKTTDHKYGRVYTYKNISITSGSKKLIDDIMFVLNKYGMSCTIQIDPRRTNSKTYYLKICKQNNIQQFKDFIYKDSGQWKLLRKYVKFA